MKVLLIEDDLDAAQHVRALLQEVWHAMVTIATTGRQALRFLDGGGSVEATHFDLILLDLGLPDVDGIDLCRRLRVGAQLRTVPLLVVSASSDEQHVEAAFESGATDFVAKPVRPRELVARIRSALRDQRDRQRQYEATLRLEGVAAQLRQTNEALERLTTIDPLTQLANRRQFNIVFHREWRRASRSGGSIAVVMADIDHFHAFNETYGHLAGDQCLIAVARAVGAIGQRSCDELARWGGEELVYVLPDADSTGARLVAERVRAAVEALAIPHETSPAAPHVTVSVGAAAMKPRPDLSPEALLGAADDAMFQAKSLGRNRVCEACVAATSHLVEIDPLIAERVPRFLSNRRDDARALLDAARVGDLALAQRIGHNLRGIGSSYGFDPISEVGARIEHASRCHDADEVRQAALDLAEYVDTVRVVPRGSNGVRTPEAERLVSGHQQR